MLIQDFGCLHKRGYHCKLKSENKNPIDFYCIVEAPRQNEEQNAFQRLYEGNALLFKR